MKTSRSFSAISKAGRQKTNCLSVGRRRPWRSFTTPVCLVGLLLLQLHTARADHVLSLSFATNSISEAQTVGATRATVAIDVPLTNNLTVLIFNPSPDQVSLPPSVLLPAGSNAVGFSVDAINNGLVDGARSVTLTVDADGFAPASATLQITDDDTPAHRTIGGKLYGHLPTNIYWVTTSLTIETNRTLTVDPSSTLLFASGAGLTNGGTLIASGGSTSVIRFTSTASTPTKGSWQGITVTSSGAPQTVLDYVEIAFAQNGLIVKPSGDQANLLLTHSSIHDCSLDGAQVFADQGIVIATNAVQIVSNTIYHNGRYGIDLSAFIYACNTSHNSASVIGNDIFENQSAGVNLHADASGSMGCTQVRRSRVDCVVAKNSIHGNQYGVYGYAHHGFIIFGTLYPAIHNNLIVNNTLGGMVLDGAPAAELLPTLVNNTIVRNGGAGIFHGTNVSAGFTIQNNLVAENDYGVFASSAFVPTNAVMACNDVWGSFLTNWVNYPAGFGALTTTNLNGTPADANKNLSLDPLFAGIEDFHLQPNSPMIDAGTTNHAPVTDFDGHNRMACPDIGYDEAVHPLLTASSPLTNGSIQIRLTSGRGLTYSILCTTNFLTWQTVVTNVTMANRNISVEVPLAPRGARGFYRAVLQP